MAYTTYNSNPYRDFFSFHSMIVMYNGKLWSVKKSCVYILTTKSRWVVSQFFNFDLVKMKVKNVLSSSTLPKTITIGNSTSLKNSNILSFKI
jgi:hypothetical protein